MNVRVFNFGIPAYKTKKGKITCPFADGCIKFCYAQKGAYIWKNVFPAFEKRYEISKQHDFPQIMTDEIIKKKADYVRVHDSGDFYSRDYTKKWIKIAKMNPEVRFYAYTNSVEMVKKLKFPKNWDIIFSDSGKQIDLIDKEVDRHTKIFHNHTELISLGYTNCSENDLMATKWFNNTNKVGLIYH
jgi:hypothetical protein